MINLVRDGREVTSRWSVFFGDPVRTDVKCGILCTGLSDQEFLRQRETPY